MTDGSPTEPDLLFRAILEVGPYEYTNRYGEKIQGKSHTKYGPVREVVGTARADRTRMLKDAARSLAGVNGAKIEGHLTACLADWKVVE
jgi:hypothetical protein